jgi:isocitrate dehydrogenase kinase/phosphatase
LSNFRFDDVINIISFGCAIQAKIAAYDENMLTRQQQLEELTQQHNTEMTEYLVLKEHFDRVDANITRTKEEESIISAVTRRENYGNYVLDRAATMIQKIVRGRQIRAVFTKMLAKARKGKKGKGKGKKK